MRRPVLGIVGLVLVGLTTLTGPAAADAAKPGSGITAVEILKATTHGDGATLSYPAGKPEVRASLIEISPGAETNHHRHPIPLFAYILEGELTLHDEDGGIRKMKAGDAFMESSDWHFGRNEGTATVKLLAVYLSEQGTPLSTPKPE